MLEIPHTRIVTHEMNSRSYRSWGAAVLDAVDGAILVVVVVFGVFCWRKRISYRLSVYAGLAFLLVSASAVSIGQADAGKFLAILAFYSLVVGIGLAAFEMRRESRELRAENETGRSDVLQSQHDNSRNLIEYPISNRVIRLADACELMRDTFWPIH